jgi:hypothetical protein
MTAVKACYDGKTFIPLSPVKAAKNQAAIATVLDDTTGDTANNRPVQQPEPVEFGAWHPEEDNLHRDGKIRGDI